MEAFRTDDLVATVAALARGQDATEPCLARLAACNPALNAVIASDLAATRRDAAASAARRAAGRALGPLDGLPFTVKDNLFAKGLPAGWGSRLFADFMPAEDDLCVARLRAAGAVLVGKTNTPEFALAAHTGNAVFGATRNPWDPTRVPAGSSGGAAVAVAMGMAPLGIGTDAGGSIRLPAAFTGISGFKPSVGVIPRLHGFPPLSVDFQSIGVLARDVAGLRLALAVLAGPDPRDRASLAFGGAAPAYPAPRLRLVLGDATDPEVAARVAAAARVLEGLGYVVTPGALPHAESELRGFSGVLSAAGVARVVARHAGWQDLVTPAIRGVAEQGLALTAVQHVAALDALAAYRAAVPMRMGADDLLVTPTCPVPPWPIDSGPSPHPAGPRMPVTFTAIANAMGWPAISIPCGLTGRGLPIGLQIIGRYGEDQRVLALAEAFQSVTAWHQETPP